MQQNQLVSAGKRALSLYLVPIWRHKIDGTRAKYLVLVRNSITEAVRIFHLISEAEARSRSSTGSESNSEDENIEKSCRREKGLIEDLRFGGFKFDPEETDVCFSAEASGVSLASRQRIHSDVSSIVGSILQQILLLKYADEVSRWALQRFSNDKDVAFVPATSFLDVEPPRWQSGDKDCESRSALTSQLLCSTLGYVPPSLVGNASVAFSIDSQQGLRASLDAADVARLLSSQLQLCDEKAKENSKEFIEERRIPLPLHAMPCRDTLLQMTAALAGLCQRLINDSSLVTVDHFGEVAYLLYERNVARGLVLAWRNHPRAVAKVVLTRLVPRLQALEEFTQLIPP